MVKVYNCVDGILQSTCVTEITKIMKSMKEQHNVELFYLSHSLNNTSPSSFTCRNGLPYPCLGCPDILLRWKPDHIIV